MTGSPLPWSYHRKPSETTPGHRDWIEDANGNIVVEHVGHIDGPAICVAVNRSTLIEPAPATGGVTEEMVDMALDAADYIPNEDNRKWMSLALAAALRSRPTVSPPPVPGVKELEWVQDGEGHWKASALTGLYHILKTHGGYRLRLSWSLLSSDGDFLAIEGAKAAAQADYEARILSALHSPPQARDLVLETFQDRVAEAHIALFHDDPTDLSERRDRFYEEATETAQSLGMTEEHAHQLVSYTFGRPSGDVRKEIGAAALTLASLCVVGGWDMMECAEADLASLRTPEKIAKVRAKRATRHGRGPLPGLDASSSPASPTEAAELSKRSGGTAVGSTERACPQSPPAVRLSTLKAKPENHE